MPAIQNPKKPTGITKPVQPYSRRDFTQLQSKLDGLQKVDLPSPFTRQQNVDLPDAPRSVIIAREDDKIVVWHGTGIKVEKLTLNSGYTMQLLDVEQKLAPTKHAENLRALVDHSIACFPEHGSKTRGLELRLKSVHCSPECVHEDGIWLLIAQDNDALLCSHALQEELSKKLGISSFNDLDVHAERSPENNQARLNDQLTDTSSNRPNSENQGVIITKEGKQALVDYQTCIKVEKISNLTGYAVDLLQGGENKLAPDNHAAKLRSLVNNSIAGAPENKTKALEQNLKEPALFVKFAGNRKLWKLVTVNSGTLICSQTLQTELSGQLGIASFNDLKSLGTPQANQPQHNVVVTQNNVLPVERNPESSQLSQQVVQVADAANTQEKGVIITREGYRALVVYQTKMKVEYLHDVPHCDERLLEGGKTRFTPERHQERLKTLVRDSIAAASIHGGSKTKHLELNLKERVLCAEFPSNRKLWKLETKSYDTLVCAQALQIDLSNQLGIKSLHDLKCLEPSIVPSTHSGELPTQRKISSTQGNELLAQRSPENSQVSPLQQSVQVADTSSNTPNLEGSHKGVIITQQGNSALVDYKTRIEVNSLDKVSDCHKCLLKGGDTKFAPNHHEDRFKNLVESSIAAAPDHGGSKTGHLENQLRSVLSAKITGTRKLWKWDTVNDGTLICAQTLQSKLCKQLGIKSFHELRCLGSSTGQSSAEIRDNLGRDYLSTSTPCPQRADSVIEQQPRGGGALTHRSVEQLEILLKEIKAQCSKWSETAESICG